MPITCVSLLAVAAVSLKTIFPYNVLKTVIIKMSKSGDRTHCLDLYMVEIIKVSADYAA